MAQMAKDGAPMHTALEMAFDHVRSFAAGRELETSSPARP